jgi:hypothetical protein
MLAHAKQFGQVITVSSPVPVAGAKWRNMLLLASGMHQLMNNCRLVLFITNGFKYTVHFQRNHRSFL